MRLRPPGLCSLALCLFLAPVLCAADSLPSWTAIGPDGGSVQALAASPARPGWILAGLGRGYGIFRSTDRGKSWAAAAGLYGQPVTGLAIDAEGGAFYAAAGRRLLKSTDGGASWAFLPLQGNDVNLVETHPRRVAVVFAGRAGALMRSGNGGTTWRRVNGPEGPLCLAFATGRRTIVYAGATNGLWKSTDNGLTWTPSGRGLPAGLPVGALAVDPEHPGVLWAGLDAGYPEGLFKSTDGGANWRLSQEGIVGADGYVPGVTELAVDRRSPSVVYAVVGTEVFRSTDAGHTWTRTAGPLPGGQVTDLETAEYGVLAATPAGVLVSTDQGRTWQLRTGGMVATVISGMAIDHREPARLYAADVQAGIFRTSSRGRPWLRLADVPLGWARPLLIDPIDPEIVYAGMLGGVARSTNGGRRWSLRGSTSCAVVAHLALDPRAPSHLFTSGFFFTGGCGTLPDACILYRSLDAGLTWECLRDGLPGRFGADLLGVDPLSSTVYVQSTFGDLWISRNDGSTWTLLHEDLAATSFAPSPLVADTLWAGQTGAVARSRDGGATWQPFTTGLPGGTAVTGLAPDPVDPATLYAATAGHGIFKSTDAGETWSPAGLWPAGVVYQGGLLVDPGDPAAVYAGTEGLGVLRLKQTGQ